MLCVSLSIVGDCYRPALVVLAEVKRESVSPTWTLHLCSACKPLAALPRIGACVASSADWSSGTLSWESLEIPRSRLANSKTNQKCFVFFQWVHLKFWFMRNKLPFHMIIIISTLRWEIGDALSEHFNCIIATLQPLLLSRNLCRSLHLLQIFLTLSKRSKLHRCLFHGVN